MTCTTCIDRTHGPARTTRTPCTTRADGAMPMAREAGVARAARILGTAAWAFATGSAVAQPAPEPIEGVWEATVTQRDCTTNAVIANFRGAQVVHRGGTLNDASGGAPTARGPGMGTWSRNPDGSYAVRFRFYRYNPDGTLAGHNVVVSTRTVAADGNSYTGATRNEVRNAAGDLLTTVCVSDTATRFR